MKNNYTKNVDKCLRKMLKNLIKFKPIIKDLNW